MPSWRAPGAVAEALPDARRLNSLDEYGLLLAGGAAVLFVVEWFASRPRAVARGTAPKE